MREGILDLFFCEFFVLFFHLGVDFVEVVVEVFEDHVKLFGDQKYFFELYNVTVIQLAQRFDLP